MKNSVKLLFSNIRNNQGIHSLSTTTKNTKLYVMILKVLVRKGFIRGFKVNNKNIEILLKYYKNKPVIFDIFVKNNIFVSYLSICKLRDTNSVLLLSTSRGILTHIEASKYKIGGFLICKIL